MAFGSAAPEIVVNAVTTIKQAASKKHGPGSDEPSIGVGAIIGSGIIAFLLIPGVCALSVTDDIQLRLKRRPLLRDVGTYAISLGLLCLFFADGVIQFYEAATLVCVYGVYVTVVVCAPKVRRVFRTHVLGKKQKKQVSFIQQAREREAAALRSSLLDQTTSGSSRESDLLLNVNGGLGPPSSSASYGSSMEGSLTSTGEIVRYDMVSNEKDLDIVQEDIDAIKEREDTRKSRSNSFAAQSIAGVEGSAEEKEDEESSTCIGQFVWKAAWPLRMLFYITCPNCEEGSDYANFYPGKVIILSQYHIIRRGADSNSVSPFLLSHVYRLLCLGCVFFFHYINRC
jgi:Ca2+/Na+ antiporter